MKSGAFVLGKDKNLTQEQVEAGFGSVWTWTAIDADSKLIVSYMLGDRGAETAQMFMRDVASRISNRVQLTTDGHRVYAAAAEEAFGSEIDYAMLVKMHWMPHRSDERQARPEVYLHELRRAPEPFDADGNASIHAAYKWPQQED